MAWRLATDLSGIALICAVLQACAIPSPRVTATTAQRAVGPAPGEPGRTEIGKASYYAPKFDGRTMADGRPYSAQGDVAASKTLPLGTTAKVTNLDTGKSAIVRVEDRGPHAKGRIIDVSSNVARKLDMKHAGVAHVAVKPLVVPHREGAASGEAPSEE